MVALIGPVLSVAFSGHDEWRLGLVLGLYGLIVILEGLVIGPYILHRTTQDALVGRVLRSHRARHYHPVLGSAAGTAATGSIFAFEAAHSTSPDSAQPPSLYRVSASRIQRPPHQPVDRHHHQRHHDGRQQQDLELARCQWLR